MTQIQQVENSVLNQVKNAYKNHPIQTLAIGVGVAILAPAVLPLVKPVAKAAIKGGVNLYQKTKGALAETGEVISDIVAEAKAEAAIEQAQKLSLSEGLIATSNTHQDTQNN